MGGHHSHDAAGAGGGGSGEGTPRRGSARSGSVDEAVAAPAPPPSMVPVEKLMKWLAQRSQKEDGVNGITEKSFTKYVFPLYAELGAAFYHHVWLASRARGRLVPAAAARAQAERVLALLDDAAVTELYVRMFAGAEAGAGAGAVAAGAGAGAGVGAGAEAERVSPAGLRMMLYVGYSIAMDHYPEGPQTCLAINKTLQAVCAGCFGHETSHSVGFVVRWLSEHCPRLILPLHRYCVHVLATRYRALAAAPAAGDGTGGAGTAGTDGTAGAAGTDGTDDAGAGLDLATPVLERRAWPAGCGMPPGGALLLSGSLAWLLAGALPPRYSRPLQPPRPDGRAWLARLVCAVPSHWVLLYSSAQHGRGANRFLHHTTAYRGPSIVLLQARDLLLAVASPQEWRDTHQYWGCGDACLLQLSPALALLERAPRMLYLNTSIRGYPKGLRAGADPRRPRLAVDEDFEHLALADTPYPLTNIEVWGCGDSGSRETQLEIKKWQVKEAERQRHVKLSAADWIEHPDRYLLELAGRPQYNNSAS